MTSKTIPTITQTRLQELLIRKIKREKTILCKRIQRENETKIRKNYRSSGTYMIWGSPGIGKTNIIEDVCTGLNFGVRVFSLSLYDQVSLQGMPVIDDENKRTTFYPNQEMPTGEDNEFGVVFLDEFSSASRAVQTAAMRLALEGQLGSYILPPGWFVICAGNLGTEDGADVEEMPTPAANRMLHFNLIPDIESFTSWGEENGINPLIINFLNFNPSALTNLNDILSHDETAIGFATPRSWTMLSHEIKDIVVDNKVKDKNMLDLFASACVGNKMAAEFMSYVAISEELKFNLADILEKAKKPSISKLQKSVRYYVYNTLPVVIKQRWQENKSKEKAMEDIEQLLLFLSKESKTDSEGAVVCLSQVKTLLGKEIPDLKEKIVNTISKKYPKLESQMLGLASKLEENDGGFLDDFDADDFELFTAD